MRSYFTCIIGFVFICAARDSRAAGQAERDLQAAKVEYEQAIPRNEAARLRYVNKLAEIADGLVTDYITSGRRSGQAMTAIDAELQKHPTPPDSDSKKLSQLLVGKWQSPRRVYVFRANGQWGSEDGPISSNWRIKGNQLIEDGSRGTIILLNADYFIYAEKDNVYFHSRVKE